MGISRYVVQRFSFLIYLPILVPGRGTANAGKLAASLFFPLSRGGKATTFRVRCKFFVEDLVKVYESSAKQQDQIAQQEKKFFAQKEIIRLGGKPRDALNQMLCVTLSS